MIEEDLKKKKITIYLHEDVFNTLKIYQKSQYGNRRTLSLIVEEAIKGFIAQTHTHTQTTANTMLASDVNHRRYNDDSWPNPPANGGNSSSSRNNSNNSTNSTSGGDGGRSSNISTTDPFITETYRHPHHYFDRTNMLARMIIIELAKRGIYKECTYNDLKEAITAVRGGDTRTIKGWIARLCTLKYIRLTNKPFIYEISKLEHIHHPH